MLAGEICPFQGNEETRSNNCQCFLLIFYKIFMLVNVYSYIFFFRVVSVQPLFLQCCYLCPFLYPCLCLCACFLGWNRAFSITFVLFQVYQIKLFRKVRMLWLQQNDEGAHAYMVLLVGIICLNLIFVQCLFLSVVFTYQLQYFKLIIILFRRLWNLKNLLSAPSKNTNLIKSSS